MGEIKSAIELAMERTKNLVMDESERKELHEKDVEARIRAILRRFVEGMTDGDGAVKELAGVDEDEKRKKSLFVNLLLAEVHLGSIDGKRLAGLLPFVDPSLQRGVTSGELLSLEEGFVVELKKKEGMVRDNVIRGLAAAGITGSAVEPNLSVWPQWREAVEEVEHAFEGPLTAWKSKVSRILG